MPKHEATYLTDPTGDAPLDPDMMRSEFARRLQARMDEKGWNQSELARNATLQMPEGKMGRDIVSAYIRAISLPGPKYLSALAKALGCKKTDLLPGRATSSGSRSLPDIDVRDAGDGRAWLRVNQAVEWPLALKILGLLKNEK